MEHSGLCPVYKQFGQVVRSQDFVRKIFLYFDFFIVPTFDTKVTEYLCSGWVFFSDIFRLFN